MVLVEVKVKAFPANLEIRLGVDIEAYPVQMVSQFVYAPTSIHWTVVFQILSYLQGTMNQALLLSNDSSLQLPAYLNSDWG